MKAFAEHQKTLLAEGRTPSTQALLKPILSWDEPRVRCLLFTLMAASPEAKSNGFEPSHLMRALVQTSSALVKDPAVRALMATRDLQLGLYPESLRALMDLTDVEPAFRLAYDAVQRHGPLAAIPAALRETGRMASDSLGMMRRMLTGEASVKNLSGPVTIARAANASAKRGADWFLYFLALLSLSLAIINLLPIPILDGGHLLYYLIELVKGSPLSESAMAAGQYLGLAVLAGLMGLAFYNDIAGLLH